MYMFLAILIFLESTGILYAGYWFYKKYLLEKEELNRQYSELDRNMTQLKTLVISYTNVLNELKQEEKYTRNQISSKTSEVKQSLNDAFGRNVREISVVMNSFQEEINNRFSSMIRNEISKQTQKASNNLLTEIRTQNSDNQETLQEEFSKSKDELSTLKREILDQESRIADMVNAHKEVAEYIKELSSTSESVFELLKLLLISSVVDKTPALTNKINPEVALLEYKKRYTLRFIVNIKGNWLKSNFSIGILGDLPELGGWKDDKILQMHKQEHNRYVLQLSISTAKPLVQFKYLLIDSSNSKELVWEGGNNRELDLSIVDNGSIIERESFFKSKKDFLNE